MQSWFKETNEVTMFNSSSPSFYLQGGFTVTKWLVVIQFHLFNPHFRAASEKYLPSLYASKFASITDFHQWYVKGMGCMSVLSQGSRSRYIISVLSLLSLGGSG